MKKILIILDIICIIGSVIWYYKDKSMEPLISIVSFTSGLLVLLYANYSENENKIIFKQKGGKNSKNYQSNRTININKKNDK